VTIFLNIDKILLYTVGLILFLASVFYIVIVWNVKKPRLDYDFFPRVSLMAYGWESGNVIERKIDNFLDQDYPKDNFEVIIRARA
jgi:cellulose synthase/poly-beta-1,6-N-acetylglucosamine synthase-like glycosyltransferase